MAVCGGIGDAATQLSRGLAGDTPPRAWPRSGCWGCIADRWISAEGLAPSNDETGRRMHAGCVWPISSMAPSTPGTWGNASRLLRSDGVVISDGIGAWSRANGRAVRDEYVRPHVCGKSWT